MKRILCFVLSAALVLTMLWGTAIAESTQEELLYSLQAPAMAETATHVQFGDFFEEGKTNAMCGFANAGAYVYLKALGKGDFTVPFTVTQDGTYDFGVTLLVLSLNKERATLLRIDDGPVYDIRYTHTEEQDGYKQYVTGISQELTAGEHTLTLSLPADFNDDTIKTLFFFDFFYARVYTGSDVNGLIQAIGEVTLEKEPLIAQAREVYETLSDEEKAQVSFYEQLVEAENTLADLKAAQGVKELIAQLPDPITAESADAIAAAQSAYDALTDAQKALVGNYADLQKAKEDFLALTSYPRGDVNKDRTVDANDALMVLKAAVNKITLTQEEATFADVNQDGEINAVDALAILKIAVGKEA